MPPEKSSFKTGISIPPSLHQKGVERANAVAGGKFARYVQQLIAADVAGDPTPSTYHPEIISELARAYAGYLAPKLALQLSGTDQPALLAQLLRQMNEEMALGAAPADLIVVARWELNPGHPDYRPMPAPAPIPSPVRTPRAAWRSRPVATYPAPIPADPQLNEPAAPAVSAPSPAPAAPTAAQLFADAARSRALLAAGRPDAPPR